MISLRLVVLLLFVSIATPSWALTPDQLARVMDVLEADRGAKAQSPGDYYGALLNATVAARNAAIKALVQAARDAQNTQLTTFDTAATKRKTNLQADVTATDALIGVLP